MAQLKSTRIFGTIKSFALTESTSVDTGALVVSGGVGIKKNLNVGGNATIKTISGNSTWSGNIIAISKGGTGLASTSARYALLGPTSNGAPTWRAITVADISDIASASTGITKVGTITTGVWNGTDIANNKLVNSSITVGNTNISLGETKTTLTGLTSVTSDYFAGELTGNASTATKLKTTREIKITGAVTGTANFDGSGNISIATTHTADPIITLAGDVSGSGTMTNLGSVSITAAVADYSHNHIIGNIDGLDTALGLKAPLASPALTGIPTAPTADDDTSTTQIATTAFVSTAVSNLVSSSPETLDTLNELAAALGDDPNFATTVATSIGTKADKTITISAGSGLIGGGDLSAARTISHADTSSQASVNNSGRTFIQDITLDDYGHVSTIVSATDADTYVGTVTSVGMSVPAGLTITKSPVTSSGILTVGFASDYSIPTITKQGNWDTAYTNTHTSTSDNQSISAGNGMDFTTTTGNASIVMGTPSTITTTTLNSASGITHTHALTLPSTMTPSAHTLDSHSNVTISSIASGELLKWNGTAWVNNTLAEAGIQASGSYQTADADLTAIAALTGTSGLLKKTAANTWTLDTTGYTTNTGTVTSVAMSVPTGLSISGTPITTTGTLALSLTNGYAIPTTTNISTWNALVSNATHTGEVTGATSLTIASNVVDADNLKVTGNGTTSQYLKSNGSGGFTWATPPNDNTNYYPTTFSWTSGKTAGPTGSLSGTGMTAVGFGAIPSASATASGVVTTGAQTFAGEKTFTGIVTESSGNDIVDLVDIEDDVEIEYGKAYFRDRDNKVKITNSKNSQSLGIASDTYGIKVGRKTDKKQLPIAIGGWVLAHVDNIYKAGTPLIASKNGVLSKASLFIKVFFPERVVAIFDRVEKEEKWNNITVNKRCWVKIK